MTENSEVSSDRILKIDLGKYRSSNSYVFAGRDRGVAVKEQIGLDVMKNADRICFIIPEDVFAISSSFLLGLLGDLIRFLKKEKKDIDSIIEVPDGFERTFEEAKREALQERVLI